MTAARCVLALDIGGTKLAAGVARDDGVLLARAQTPTPPDDGELVYRTLVDLARAQLTAAGVPVLAVGVGCAGPMRYPEGVVSPLNAPAWRDFPLRARLQETFALPTLVDNDAKAVALGEHWRGGGQGEPNMLGMVVSTGVGGGLIVDGRLLHGSGGNAGHIGHVIVFPDGPACQCGAFGCLEAVASGTALARRLGWAQDAGEPTCLPRGAQGAEIAAAARAGDPLAQRLYHEAGVAVGRAIASTAALVDIRLALIGGSVALKSWDLLGPPLEVELRRSAQLGFTRDVQARQATLADNAGLVGAAALGFGLLLQ